jgi:hypothetical protein
MEQISAWIGMWSRAAASTRSSIGRSWVKAYRIVAAAKKQIADGPRTYLCNQR